MSNSLNPVFGEWYTERQLGSGTDGKVFSIYREKYDGTKERSVLKIIRLGENRGDIKTFDPNENIVIENEEVVGQIHVHRSRFGGGEFPVLRYADSFHRGSLLFG